MNHRSNTGECRATLRVHFSFKVSQCGFSDLGTESGRSSCSTFDMDFRELPLTFAFSFGIIAVFADH